MTPPDLIIWGICFLIASIPIALGVLIIGAACIEVRKRWPK